MAGLNLMDPPQSELCKHRSWHESRSSEFGGEAGFVKFRLLGALLAFALMVFWFALHDAQSRSEAMEKSGSPASIDHGAPAEVRTRLDVVKEFLGDKWPLAEARLSKEQVAELTAPCAPADFGPWSVVEPLIRRDIRDGLQKQRDEWIHRFRDKGWPKSLTSGPLNPTGKQLGPQDLLRIQKIVDEAHGELEPLAALAFDLLVEAEEAIWDQGRYQACPFIEFSAAGDKECHAQLVTLERWKRGAWTVSYSVDSSEWPALDAVLKEMDEIASRRDRGIESYLAGI